MSLSVHQSASLGRAPPCRLEHDLAVPEDTDHGEDTDQPHDVPDQAHAVVRVEVRRQRVARLAGEVDKALEGFADRDLPDFGRIHAELFEPHSREFVLGGEAAVEPGTELPLDGPADGERQVRETQVHGPLFRRRDVAHELVELGAREHLAQTEDGDHADEGEGRGDRSEHEERDRGKEGAEEHAPHLGQLAAQPGKKETGGHDHGRVEVQETLGLDDRPVLVHGEHELPEAALGSVFAEEVADDDLRIDPVVDVGRKDVEQGVEHEPEEREHAEEDPDVRLLELAPGVLEEVGPLLALLPAFALLCQAFLLPRLLVHEEEEEIQADDARAGVEHVGPVPVSHVARDQGADEPADVHGLVEDTPGHGSVVTRGRVDHGSLDTRLEDAGSEGQNHRARGKAHVVREESHDQVSNDLHDRGSENGFLVPEPVAQSSGEDGNKALGKGPDQHDVAEDIHGDPEASLGSRLLGVEDGNGLHPVVGEAFHHLHATTDPKHIAQAGQGNPKTELFYIVKRALGAPPQTNVFFVVAHSFSFS